MADNLDDEWWQESLDKNPDTPEGSEQEDDVLESKYTENSNTSSKKSRKRKIKNVHHAKQDGSPIKEKQPPENDEKPVSKKKKKRKTITEELQTKGTVFGKPSDLISLIHKHFKDKLSSVEWDDMILEDEHFCVCNDSNHTPVSYLRTILPKWKKMVNKETLDPGSPLVLILTASAIRAATLNREISLFRSDGCKSVKLFGKHMKITEQQEYLKKTICHLGVGTPQRVMALIKLGALKMEKLRIVVIDWNWRDIKQKRLIDIHEPKSDLMLLLKDHLIPHFRYNQCKIGFL